MVERKTIRPEKELYEDLNAERKEAGVTWDEYLRKLQQGSTLETRINPKQRDVRYTG